MPDIEADVGQPDGWQPGGWQPEAGEQAPASTLLGRKLCHKVVDDEVWYRFDFSDDLSDGVTLASVACNIASPLTKVAEATDTEAGTYIVRIGAGVHAGLYPVRAVGTLSNAETVPIDGAIRVFG